MTIQLVCLEKKPMEVASSSSGTLSVTHPLVPKDLWSWADLETEPQVEQLICWALFLLFLALRDY